jgi:hypothetical protein
MGFSREATRSRLRRFDTLFFGLAIVVFSFFFLQIIENIPPIV